MSTGWNLCDCKLRAQYIINLLGNEYWLEPGDLLNRFENYYKPTGK